MKKRFIKLTEEERDSLRLLKNTGKTRRERERSHALLLSDKGFDTNQLREIFDIRMATLLDWMNRWENEGFKGLSDKPGRGRKRKLTFEEEKK